MDSVSEESTITLIQKLIDHSICEIKPKSIQINGRQTLPSKHKLKSNILNILFANQHLEDQQTKNKQLSEVEELTWMTYKLSQKHDYDKSHRLKLCIDKLQLKGNKEQDGLSSILHVLIGLSKLSMHKQFSLFDPWIIADKNDKWDLPHEPLNYGDTRLHTSSANWFYVHYPSHLFDDRNLSREITGSCRRNKFSSCDLDPGSSRDESTGKKNVLKRCLGAMLNPFCVPNPGIVLSIPELPDRKEGLEVASIFRSCLPSSARSYQEQETDEGYASSQCSVTGDISEIPEFCNLPVEKTATRLQTEKKYVTESSCDVVKRLWRLNHYHWNIFSEHPISPIWNEKLQEDLCKDILHLIVGVESNSFKWLENENTFELKEGICCKGMTPGSIKSHVEEYIQAGTKLRKLEKLCSESLNNNKGLVWAALIRSIKMFLVIFRGKVLSYDGALLPMRTTFSGLLSKLYFLCATCDHLTENCSATPVGLETINVLFQKMRTSHNPSQSYLILSILRSCCEPFFQFLERWIYLGDNYDPYSEFFVSSDRATLLFKDNRYRTDGHTLVESQFDGCEPLIRAVLQQAFVCGKAVSFLAAFSGRHSLIVEAKCDHPKIIFGWSRKHLDEAGRACVNFADKVKQTSVSLNEVLLEQYDDICKEKEISLINSASEQRMRTVKKIKAVMNTQRESKMKQKQLAMDALLRDMEESRKQKTGKDIAERTALDAIATERQNMEQLDRQTANKMRNEIISSYEEYLTESNKKEGALKEKLKRLNLNLSPGISADDRPTVGINPSSTVTFKEDCLSPLNQDGTILRPRFVPESPLEELSEMSTTSDDIPSVRIDIVDNYIRSRDSPVNPICPTYNSEESSDYNCIDGINHNITTNHDIVNIDRSMTDTNQNVTNEVSNFISSPTTTTPNDVIKPDEALTEDGSVISESGLHSADDMIMSTATSMDSIGAVSVGDLLGLGTMKKSKSDTFFAHRSRPSEGVCRRPKSCLFETSMQGDLPVLRDQDDMSWPRKKPPTERFSDKDLLAARNLEQSSKVSAYDAPCDLQLCDELPESNTLLKANSHSMPDDIPQEGDISTTVNYITRTISLHVAAQSKLANEAILSHLLIDQGLLNDFNVLQSVMLTQDASICRSLVANLVRKLTPCCNPSTLLTPKELNSVLNESLSSSALGQKLRNQLFFVVTKVPFLFESPYDIWDCVQLQYKVQWPNSVIVDTAAMDNYVKIWNFLMKIHHSVYTMDELYRSFLRETTRLRILNNQEVHQLSVMAYEMQNFIRVLLSYVSHQGILTSVSYFEKNLRKGNLTVDELYELHAEFLNIVMAKCFLNEKGSLVLNLITDIFAKVHKFVAILNASSTFQNGSFLNEAFQEAKKLSEQFKKMVLFLNKLLQKVSIYTRVDHIEAFDLLLHFNPNYNI